ncbi:NarK/NasA family nitrate transporter [Nanchangia anserum]|uniref:NarK/NasA family nitrate transporter n=1 Tax=Nanchangia anserum TaxID=2692125 RepID=A0A8I0GBN2_9ACTO|nr:nitrate/nitrite transporter [Nanchangia anserum]MBD3689051.1 NarK/NasA family nitrate transporter [Nanchangia anserum]QOX81293.1 NarK/NasA family nitrate transporter [Nanchangia anserum]
MAVTQRKGTLVNWDPENPDTWSATLAWKTLAISTYSLTLAFCVWFLVSALAPRLNDVGFDLTKGQLYWLTSMPGLSCGFLRLIYMFMPATIGTRKLVGISSLLYIIPMLGWFFAVQNPDTPYWWLLCLAFLCGIGGGSFSGYMPSTGFFFPKRLSGTALGIQAGIGNLGMSIIQLASPLLMGFGLLGMTWVAPARVEGGDLYIVNPAIFFIPWCLLAAVLAFTQLKDVPVKASVREQLDIFSNPDTWLMTLMYVMTFGTFSGFAAQFGLMINNNFGESSPLKLAVAGASYAFLAPLIGSLVRVAWGPLCDKYTGGLWTFVSGVGQAVCFAIAGYFTLAPEGMGAFWGFLVAMLAMFFFTGLGNAGTFKQMPMIMPKRQAGGAIGFTAAVASFGPFFVGIALSSMSATAWLWCCAAFCVVGSCVCWFCYARPGAPARG